MKERPILFSGKMVRAILEGRKTQTRRVMAKVPADADGPYEAAMAPQSGPYSNQWAMRFGGKYVRQRCPYGQVGDWLWVRESMGRWESGEKDSFGGDLGGEWFYKADEAHVLLDSTRTEDVTAMRVWAHHKDSAHCPSIHMPRWASRLTLEITKIRVERVQKITNEDAQAEGCDFRSSKTPNHANAFAILWDSINAERGFGWDANPFVWVIEFKEVKAQRKRA